MKIGAFICICEPDIHWLEQLIPSLERIGIDVAWWADKLTPEHVEKLRKWKHTVFIHENKTMVFNERVRQIPFDWLQKNGYDWAIQWDADEVWPKKFDRSMLEDILSSDSDAHMARLLMKTVWEQDGKLYFRSDGQFSSVSNQGRRDRIYNLKYKWQWLDPITYNAYLMNGDEPQRDINRIESDLHTIHWGFYDKFHRNDHRSRWAIVHMDNIGRAEPYGIYAYVTDEKVIPTLEPYEP